MPVDEATRLLTDAPRRYAALPGPARIPLLGNAHQIKPDIFHQQLEAWAREHGPCFQLRITRRRMMVISDPEVIGSVLRRRPQLFKKGPRLVQVAKDLGLDGVFTANDDDWRRQRQLVMQGLDPAHLRTYLPAVVAVTERLKAKWLAGAQGGRDIDLLTDLMRYTVDVTTCLAFGDDLHTLEQGDDAAIQQHLNVIFPALFRRTLAPVDFRHWIKDRAIQQHVDALQNAVQQFIARARQQLSQRPELRDQPENMIQALVAAHDAGQGLSDGKLSGNLVTMLLAGEDTTAHTLAWLIWLISNAPAEIGRAQAEVDRHVGVRSIANSIEQLAGLDYVDACANEAMRLKPVAPINVLEAAEDVDVGGVQVPKGTFVICLMRPSGMDSARFPEPGQFRPSRWLAGDAAAGEGGEAGRMFAAKRVVMPFGAGPRVCPGRYLALAEIKMVMAMLLSNFSITKVWAPEGEPRERLTLTMAPVGLKMRLAPR